MKNKKINLNEKILISGASGMVGSSLKRILLKAGYGQEKLRGKLFCPTRKELNLLNYQDVKDWFSKFKPTVVIISAAKVGGIMANSTKPFDFILENLKIQTNLIEISWLFGIKRLLFLGSSCIYPKFANQPIIEDYLLSGTLEKTNEFYAIAKISGLKLCESLRIQHNFDAISLMPTNLYGPGDNYHKSSSHVMASLIRKFVEAKKLNFREVKCWGSGNPLREFLYVEDLAEACLYALENWNPDDSDAPRKKNGEKLFILNVGSDYEISIKQLAEKIANLTFFNGSIKWDRKIPDGTPRKKLDTSKINQIGWKAKTNLDEGIKKTLYFYKEGLIKNELRIND